MKKTDETIVVEASYNTSISQVWNALTEPHQMRDWFFENIKDFKAKEGFETSFVVTNQGRVFPHLWKVTEVLPQKRLTLNWKYGNYAGDSEVIFELIQHNEIVKLKLTHHILESFPENVPEFSRSNCEAGWKYFIQQNLKQYLEKQSN